MLLLSALNGLILMLSLIVAIGPQNAFLLRQAVRHEHALLVASIMLSGDALMVLLGSFGVGHLLEKWLLTKLILTIIGAIYIFVFGLRILLQINQPKSLIADKSSNRRNILMGTLAVTFLNPHAILDTILIIGTISLQFHHGHKIAFILGAILGSTIWFYAIAWIGQKLAPFLSQPKIWRAIDAFIVIVMFILVIILLRDAWQQVIKLLPPPNSISS